MPYCMSCEACQADGVNAVRTNIGSVLYYCDECVDVFRLGQIHGRAEDVDLRTADGFRKFFANDLHALCEQTEFDVPWLVNWLHTGVVPEEVVLHRRQLVQWLGEPDAKRDLLYDASEQVEALVNEIGARREVPEVLWALLDWSDGIEAVYAAVVEAAAEKGGG